MQEIKYEKVLQYVLQDRKKFASVLYSRPESLRSLLPYDEYISDKKIFHMKDGSLGAVFEVTLIEHEPITSQKIITTVEKLKPLLSLPENCVCQILFDQSVISKDDKVFHSKADCATVEGLLLENRIKQIRSESENLSANAPLKRSCYFTVRYFPSVKRRRRKTKIFNPNSTLHSTMHDYTKDLQNFYMIIKDLESNSQISLQQLSAHELVDYLRLYFNPQTYYKRSFAKFNPSDSIDNQFLFNSPELNFDGMSREGVKTRTISLKTSPQFAYPGSMAYFLTLDFPFRISLNISFPSRASVKRFFDFKEFFLENSMSAKSRYQREEIAEVQERLVRDDKCLHLTFTVVIEGQTDEELDRKARHVCNVFNNKMECEVIEEKDIGLALALNSLPLSYSPESDFSAQRYIRILRSDVVNFMPVFDSYKGYDKGENTYLSREKNLIKFKFHPETTPEHSAILGGRPREQDLFVNEFIHGVKRENPDALIFVIDKGSRHRMLGEFYNADVTVFSHDSEIPFSPFRGFYDEEKVGFLTNLLSSAIELTSPNFTIESEHKTAISKAIRQAYLKKHDRSGLMYLEGKLQKVETDIEVQLLMEDIISELGSLSEKESLAIKEIVDPLMMKLKPFYGDGMYARYFKGSTSHKNSQKNFWIYDLDALQNDKTLQTLLTMSVTEEIRRILTLKENRDKKSYLIIKDFTVLGKSNAAFKEYATVLTSSMADKGCSIIPVARNPQDFLDSDIGQTFWGASDQYFFLPMNTDQVDYLSSKSSLMDEANTEIIRSLRASEQKIEFYKMDAGKTSQGALMIDITNIDHWLCPGNSKDVATVTDILAQNKSKTEAITALIPKTPSFL